MRLIDGGDDRLFHTATVAARLGRAEKILEPLLADYDDNWDDPEAGFRYGLALVAVIQAGGTDQQKRDWYTRSMEALDDVVEGDPEHWLARYCRIRNRVLIRTGYGRYQEYLNDELGKVADDVQQLLHRQEQVPWQPYFAAGLLLAAQFHAGQGDQARAADLVAGAASRDGGPVPWRSLGTIMSEPMLVLYHGSLPPPVKSQIVAAMLRLFPGSPAVRSTVRAGAQRPP
ncbi:hypothetical protein AB0H83_45560 [Dactylosporangium sp. NPDC050688]|uniref:hypothetical protein n=1 Tax=Dactylosporangium sp. NPDC050688 TaxID=3157217 RepID=UPI0033E64E6E